MNVLKLLDGVYALEKGPGDVRSTAFQDDLLRRVVEEHPQAQEGGVRLSEDEAAVGLTDNVGHAAR